MGNVTTIGLDIAKNVFQVHGVDEQGLVVLTKQLRRGQVLAFFKKVPPCLVGMEACATAHHWARELTQLGHTVKLMPPSYVKAYVRRGKNDAADAAAICEAVTRPSMRFVPVKTVEQQVALMLHRSRDLLIRQRTQLINALRAHLAELGLVAAVGADGLKSLMDIIREAGKSGRLPKRMLEALNALVAQLAALSVLWDLIRRDRKRKLVVVDETRVFLQPEYADSWFAEGSVVELFGRGGWCNLVGAVVFLAIFCFVLFFVPEMGGYFLEYNNFIPADPLKTPPHIAPVWYFTPFYSILRAVPPMFNSQFPGVIAMGVSTLIFFLLPWLDRSPVKSIRYKGPLFRAALTIFVIVFLVLGYLGTEPTNVWGQFGSWLGNADRATVAARIGTTIYFLFFLLMPWYSKIDKCKPEPERVTW